MKRRLPWIFFAVGILLIMGVAKAYSQWIGTTLYMPVVLRQATWTPSITFTPTFTLTPTITFSPTFTLTQTKTVTPSFTSTQTRTFTPSTTPSKTSTSTATPVLSPPLWSRTAYINTDGGQIIYDLGCSAGTRDKNTSGKQDTVVVLDFGSPTAHGTDGTYGTSLFGIGYLRTSEIATRAQLYAQGYYVCVGTDRESQLTLAIGTTNYGTWLASGSNAQLHGIAWANMVNNVNTWLVQQGYASQVTAVGASDIELTWNSPTVSKNWVNGYDAVNLYDMYDYGDMAGCPSRDRQSSICWPTWTMADVWYVAYGAPPSYPLPLIYANSGVNARQWSWLSKWSLDNKGYRMDIVGSFTQCQACLQRIRDTSCEYLDNKPAEGWQQLFNELITDGVGQGIRWSTDIFWLGDSTQVNPNLCNSTSAPQTGLNLEQRALALEAALQSDRLSEDIRISLTEKLETTNFVIYQQQSTIPAGKDTPALLPGVVKPEFSVGIFEGDEGMFKPWQVQIKNRWQGLDGEQKIIILAGKQASQPEAGVLFIWKPGSTEDWVSVNAPTGMGELRILADNGFNLIIVSSSGNTFLFKWQTNELIGDSERN